MSLKCCHGIFACERFVCDLQIESLLDEATAELGKMEFSPMLSTIEADFKIRKSVPLHTTLKIECEVSMSAILHTHKVIIPPFSSGSCMCALHT